MANSISEQYANVDFSPIQALTDGEVITHSPVRDIRLASGKVLALITLDTVSYTHLTLPTKA